MTNVTSTANVTSYQVNKYYEDSRMGYDYSINTNGASSASNMEFTYDINEAGSYYVYGVYYGTSLETQAINIKKNGSSIKQDGDISRPYILNAGNFVKGDKLSVSLDNLPNTATGNFALHVAKINDDVFKEGYNKLAQNTLKATKCTDTQLNGVLESNTDGLFYTSIVYEDGWTVKVDGEKVDTKKVGGALLAFDITAGKHKIEISYLPSGYLVGTLASILGIILLLGFAFLYRSKLKNTFIFKYKTHPNANPDRFDDEDDENFTEEKSDEDTEKEENYVKKEPSIGTRLFFSIIFSVVYFVVWLGSIIKKMQILCKEDSNYAVDIILSFIVPFYFVYVMFKYGKKKEEIASTKSLKVTSAFNHLCLELGASCGLMVSIFTFLTSLVKNYTTYNSQVQQNKDIVAGGGQASPITVSLFPTGVALTIMIFCIGLWFVLRFVNMYLFEKDIQQIGKQVFSLKSKKKR